MTPEEIEEDKKAMNREAVRRWREADPDRAREVARVSRQRWRAAHPAEDAARKAKERGAKHVEVVDPQEIFRRDKWTCHICGEHVEIGDVSLDHVIPLVLGGAHTAENLACAHRSCNFIKKDRPARPCGGCGEMVVAGAPRCSWCGLTP